LNRHDAKDAKIHRAQNTTTLTDANVLKGVLEQSVLKSAPGGLGGPRWRLGGETVPRIGVSSAMRHAVCVMLFSKQ